MAASSMKALRAHKADGPPQLAVEKVDVPTPGTGELLIKIYASAVQPADILNAHGSFPHTTFPRTLGKDFAGVVVAGSSKLQGQKVFGTSGHDFSFTHDGGQAEYAIVAADAVAIMPKNLSFVQAATLGTPWSTAALTLARTRAQPGETVMVLGATGSVGSAAVQIATSHGLKTIGVGRHGTAVNSVADPSLSKAVELTGGKGPDVVVDTVGDLALLQTALSIMADRGRLAVISAPRKGDTHLPVDIFHCYRKQHSIVGCNSVDTPVAVLAEMLQDLVPAFEAGRLQDLEQKEWKQIDLQQAVDAYAGKIEKAVVVFDG